MKDPLVSIIIPVYNRPDFIKESAASVLNQSYRNIELIIVDDGSTDDTATVIRTIAEKDSRVTYLYQKNAGAAAATNLGLSKVKGDFVGFLDSDDIFLPEKIQKQVDFFYKNPITDLVLCDFRAYDLGGKPVPISTVVGFRQRKKFIDSFHVLLNHATTLSTVLCRRKVIEAEKLDTNFQRGYDYEWLLRCARKFKVDFMDEVLINYRFHSNNLSRSDNVAAMQDVRLVLEKLAKVMQIEELKKYNFFDNLAWSERNLGASFIRNGRLEEGRWWIVQSLKRTNISLRQKINSCIFLLASFLPLPLYNQFLKLRQSYSKLKEIPVEE